MAVTNGYCTLAQLRTHLGDTGSTLTTELLERAINATSRAIDEHCDRRFWVDTQVATRTYRPTDRCLARVDDISTTTGLVIKTDNGDDGTYETTWSSTDYELEPQNADADSGGYAWWRIRAVGSYEFPVNTRRKSLQVTAKFGWSEIPPGVEQACLIRASAIFKRNEAVFGITGVGELGVVRIGRADPDVLDLLYPFEKRRLLVG